MWDSSGLTKEDIEAIVAARETKEKESREKGAAELFKILDRPQANAGMSRKFTFGMFGGDSEVEDEQE